MKPEKHSAQRHSAMPRGTPWLCVGSRVLLHFRMDPKFQRVCTKNVRESPTKPPPPFATTKYNRSVGPISSQNDVISVCQFGMRFAQRAGNLYETNMARFAGQTSMYTHIYFLS